MCSHKLSHGDILRLKRWNTPSIYNGWEQITKHDASQCNFNIEETHDFMPQMGPMVGYAATLVIQPSEKSHLDVKEAASEYRRYISELDGPIIVVVQDLDKPNIIGSTWGEVNSNVHKAFGCVGTITDGAIRDVDEMTNSGFKALARRLCVGHAYATPVRWNCEVKVFGAQIQPGQLLHADKHGFLVIPDEDQKDLLDAVAFMDSLECDTLINAARASTGKTRLEIWESLDESGRQFFKDVAKKFGNRGEW